MKYYRSSFSLAPSLLAAICIITFACNKKFDEPPVYKAPDITPDLTISELKAMHSYGRFEQITEDKTIGGIVIADDRSGQFYKTIVIQDETAGISIKLDAYDLYTSYPVGRKVYIKVKDLFLGDNNKLIELGGGIDNSGFSPRLDDIPSALIDEHLIKGTVDNVVTPKLIQVEELDNYADQNTLIQLDNYEFAGTDTAKTFAKPDLSSSAVNFTLQSCSGKPIVLRNSSYADFAGYNVPNGNGTITAVFTVFGSTQQLYVRDSADVKFYNNRCGAGGTGEVIDLKTLKSFYNGTSLTLGAYKISGVVISDPTSKNIAAGNIVVQDKDAGIKLYFGSSATTSKFNTGDSLVIDVAGGVLQEYNGAMEISLSASDLPAAALATGKTVLPKELTIQQVKEQLPGIEYTLVTVKDATSEPGTFSGNKKLTDATGSLTLYTLTGASFAGNATPAEAKTYTGYCLMFNSTAEMIIRNINDVTDGSVVTPSDDNIIISEYVEGSSGNKYLELYNAGTDAADLSKYTLKLYTNGSSSASSTAVLNVVTGLPALPAKSIVVLKYSGASLTLPAGINAYNSAVCNFNGNDAVTLEKNGIITDVFGSAGTDPGTSWTISGDISAAKDKTVRRKSTYNVGNPDWSSSAVSEWDVVLATDDVTNLGTR